MADQEESSESVVSPEQDDPDQNETNSETQGGRVVDSTARLLAPASTLTGEGSSRPQRRRARVNDPGASRSDRPKQRRRAELDAPSFDPVCYVCNKSFGSWKAVFGHLRAHPRATPGAFPPPKFKAEGYPEMPKDHAALQQQLAPTLLELAHRTMQRLQEGASGFPLPPSSSLRLGPRVDLTHPGGSSSARNVHGFDLNLPPPKDEGEDGGDGDGNGDSMED